MKNIKVRLNLDNVFDKSALAFLSPTATGDGLFGPLNPRTFQATISVGLQDGAFAIPR